MSFASGDPQFDAQHLVTSHSPRYVHEFARTLNDHLVAADLDQALTALHLSEAQASALFDVSRQAVHKWRTAGVPTDRLTDVYALIDTAQLLSAYIKPERIPVVVRRPSPAHNGLSLLDIARLQSVTSMYQTAREVLDLHRIVS